MITPVSAAPVPVAAAGRTQDPPPRPQSPPVADTAPAPKPLSLDVARTADGVFVYTLSDPATGAVLAVIPNQDVQPGRDGRNLDQRV